MVILIIAALIGILIPVVASTRTRAQQVTCSSNLRQIGIALMAELQDKEGVYPFARYMPEPFLSTTTDPSFAEVFKHQLPLDNSYPGGLGFAGGKTNNVYACPQDDVAFPLSGMSYNYSLWVQGRTIEENWFVRRFGVNPEQVVVMSDFDDIVDPPADLTGGGTVEVPERHFDRNILFGDGHVGYNIPGADE